ncbi:hypothetical protein G4B88_011597 [Cannabis sativa]|uniref:Reverse transcriptase zinc-binding domain-containing protein n=1 Tax=Cannabis sativa TaxID=3483 RepID=A0A7J6GHF2_CANSA|nr:hypothetical protein G4B88_011596 [Cannabis sativa]KAF4382268.1 hypothetical protein G4B88_011597 [Cannabis sativa]
MERKRREEKGIGGEEKNWKENKRGGQPSRRGETKGKERVDERRKKEEGRKILKADVSWYWRKILRLRDSFTREAIMKAGTNGNFSIRQAYDYLISKETSFDSKKAVWCKLSTPKHRFIMWQMVHSNLLTRDNLVKKHFSIDSAYCPRKEGNNKGLLGFITFVGCVFSYHHVLNDRVNNVQAST